MPELPEVEVVVRGLRQKLPEQSVTAIPVLKPHVLANVTSAVLREKIINQRFTAVSRLGKYIILKLSGNLFLVNHLRMTGRLTVMPKELKPTKHTAFIFTLEDNSLVFDDIRKFGRLWLTDDLSKLTCLNKLGPDALSVSLPEFKRLFNAKKPVKNLLLDQGKIAGLGNIYVCEILFLAKVHPLTPANDLSGVAIRRIHKHIKPVLELSITSGGASISDYVNSEGVPGEFQKILKVYGRENEPCPLCSTPINRQKIAGRSTYFCPHCQEACGPDRPSSALR